MQSPQPVIVGDLFPEVLDELVGLLADLSAEDWHRATACPGWSVRDVALHLLGGELGNLSRRRDGHVVGASIAGWEELVTFIDGWNRDWVQVAQRISPRLLVDLLGSTGEQLCAYFSSLDPYAMGGSVSWVGPDPAPVWLDLAREYTERWHHQQHIRDAVGKPGLKEPRYLAPALATFVWAMPRAFRTTDAAEGTSVMLTITGDSGGQWSLLPAERFRDYQPPKPSLPRAPGESQHQEWLRACRGGAPAFCRFEGFAATLTEALLVADLSVRTGQKITWDAEKMEASGCPEAGPWIKRQARTGW